MGLEYVRQTLLAKSKHGGEWREYQIVALRCYMIPGQGENLFIETGNMADEAISVPVSPEFLASFRHMLQSNDGPMAPTFNFTYNLGRNELIPTGIVYYGEFYSLS